MAGGLQHRLRVRRVVHQESVELHEPMILPGPEDHHPDIRSGEGPAPSAGGRRLGQAEIPAMVPRMLPALSPSEKAQLHEAREQGWLWLRRPERGLRPRVLTAWHVQRWEAGLDCPVARGPGPELDVQVWFAPGRRWTRAAEFAFLLTRVQEGAIAQLQAAAVDFRCRPEALPAGLDLVRSLVEECQDEEGRRRIRERVLARCHSIPGESGEGIQTLMCSGGPARPEPVPQPVPDWEYPLYAAALQALYGSASRWPLHSGTHFEGMALPMLGLRAWLLPFLGNLRPEVLQAEPAARHGLRLATTGFRLAFSRSGPLRPGRRVRLEVHPQWESHLYLDEVEGTEPTDRLSDLLTLERQGGEWQVTERRPGVPRWLT